MCAHAEKHQYSCPAAIDHTMPTFQERAISPNQPISEFVSKLLESFGEKASKILPHDGGWDW